MDEAYFDPRDPGSFGGVQRLYQSVKDQGGDDVTVKKTKQFLSKKRSYTLHKDRRHKFQRNRFEVSEMDDLWQSDLADMASLARWNEGIRYLLVVIDSLSKYLWIQPVKRKDAESVLSAVQAVLAEAGQRRPRNWLVDKGGEFQNRQLIQFMKDNDINFYSTRNPDTKAAIAERVIRTIKGRIYRYLTHRNTWRYVDKLPDFVHAYNHAKHRSIGMKPVDVTSDNQRHALQKLFPNRKNLKIKFVFQIGDKVRLAKERTAFGKGYKHKWTDEVFTVSRLYRRIPPVYGVTDAKGDTIEGTFYAQEIQKIDDSAGVYQVEKIMDERTRRGRKEYLIKWLGFPEHMASWEPEENLTIPSSE